MILDLLGLGVPPDYLLQCGLSRELIYFAFTELRLRLPTGFDTAGIPQYSPEFLESLFESHKSVEWPDAGSSVSRMQEQPIQWVDKPADTPSGSTSATPTIPVSGSPSLLDIEQQRRRELLARKAVIASRKGKQPHTPALRTPSPQSTNASSVNTPFKDVEMTSAEIAPAATVDDFLNSIGPNQSTTIHESLESPLPVSDGMDVDEIPGLGGIWPSEELTVSVVERPSAPIPSGSPTTSTLPVDTLDSVGTPTGPPSSGESTPLLPETSIAPQRRGAKRPVAADFVDAERSHMHSYYPSFSNGQSQSYPSYGNRRTGGFAGITNTRRCVIDLSDSEDEEYPEETDDQPQSRSLPPSRHGSFNSYFAANGQFSATNTPPPTGGNSLSGATLLEKELEIKRMREMIAQKEQMRLRKLVGVPIYGVPQPYSRADDRSLREILQDRAQHRAFRTLPPPSPYFRMKIFPLPSFLMMLSWTWTVSQQLRRVSCIAWCIRLEPIPSIARITLEDMDDTPTVMDSSIAARDVKGEFLFQRSCRGMGTPALPPSRVTNHPIRSPLSFPR